MTVEIENAANSSLLAELWFAEWMECEMQRSLLFLRGLAQAFWPTVSSVTGHDGVAGEFGHIPIVSTGVLCGCGQVGCWETVASNGAALRYYAESVPTSNELTFQELLNLAEEGDPQAAEALERQATF